MIKKLYPVDARLLLKHMRLAQQNGVSSPTYQVGGYQLAWWGEGEHPALYVAHRTPFSQIYLGYIKKGRMYPTQAFRDKDIEPIQYFVEHPIEAAAAAAQIDAEPRCACCQRRLGKSDIATGIGATCWDKWQWPKWQWPRKGTKRILLQRGRRNGRATRAGSSRQAAAAPSARARGGSTSGDGDSTT